MQLGPWILSLLLAVVHVPAMPTNMDMIVTTMKPQLIMRNAVDEPKPMLYHFIIDQRPSTLGENYYIKPGQMVGTFNLDSGTLLVRNDGKRPISSKLNILFVANAKEVDASIRSKLNEQ